MCNGSTSFNETELEHNKHVKVFKYNEKYTDSVLITEQWYLNDSLVKGTKFSYRLPFVSEFADELVLANLQGETEIESFLEGMCEAGGTSAWNKYTAEYDSLDRPILIKHYKAWWYEGLDDKPQPKNPTYFLGEKIEFEYGTDWQIERAYNAKNELLEQIEKRYDAENRLVFEHWQAWDTYRYKVFYVYCD